MATWPSSLPQSPLINGYSRTQQPQVARTPMDSGPAYQRRRFTAASKPITMMFNLDKAQRQTFWDFFNNTVSGGALPFDWVDPVDGSSVTFSFVGDSVPMETALSAEFYQIAVSMEILP